VHCVSLLSKLSFSNICRGDDGELRLGVRRAIQLKNEALFEDFNSDSTKRHSLTAVADSLKNRSVFHISYNPR
jgi:auxin response factor